MVFEKESCTRTEPERRIEREKRRSVSTLAIVLIALLVTTAFIVVLAFLPVRTVHVSESRDVPYKTGVDTINLDFTTDVARVNVAFEDLNGKLVSLNVSATGEVGILISPDIFDLTFNYTIVDNVLTVTSEVDAVKND